MELTSGTEPGDRALVSLGDSASNDGEATVGRSGGGSLGLGQVRDQTQIDEIFNALDEETRNAFQQWQRGSPCRSRGAASTSTTRSGTWARSSVPMRPT
ncbi:MAG: hypothetical protein M9964_14295 [Solirubrobacterales bacterium]|nr:hypothetical protein [Solirubrobacterales bacterium]